MSIDRTRYAGTVLGRREPLLDNLLRDSLLGHSLRPMQVDDNAARLLQLLVMIHRPMRLLEVGTYFGYSAIHLARGLPPGGHLTTVEADRDLATLAGQNISAAGLSDRVTVVTGPAEEHLRTVRPGTLDMIFIDAAKKSYPQYLKLCYPALAPGGLLIADDAFCDGNFAEEAGSDGDGTAEVAAIHTYNRAVGRSPHLFSAFVGTENGLLVSYKLRATPTESGSTDAVPAEGR